MKRIRFFFSAISLFLCLLFSFGLMSCSGSAKKDGERDAVIEHFRDKMSETAPVSSDTVFWTKNGSVYHLYNDCRFLSRSDEVRSGTLAHSGRSRLCGTCAQRSQENGDVSSDVDGDVDVDVDIDGVGSDGGESATSQTTLSLTESESSSAPIEAPITTAAVTQELVPIVTSAEPPPYTDRSPDVSDAIPSVVYWTPKGKVWHANASCPSLARSKVVNSGTIEQSGKSRGCSKCT